MISPASLRRRSLAFIYDALILVLYLVSMTAIALVITYTRLGEHIPPSLASSLAMNLVSFATTVLPFILYYCLQEASPAQATWGKRKAGIMVTALNGKRLTFWRALLRSVVKFLPWQIAHMSLFAMFYETADIILVVTGLVLAQAAALAYLLILVINKTHRTPYDWIAGTMVTDSPAHANKVV